jgi:HEAT repeat protein
MHDIGKLNNLIHAVDRGDDAARREAVHALKAREDWESVPVKVIHSLVDAIRHQLPNQTKQPSIRQEMVTILGNLRERGAPAIPQLIDLLQDGNPDGIREASAAALGKIGSDARAAVDQLIYLLTSGRATLVTQSIRALSGIGVADSRVRTALIGLWQSPAHSQNMAVQLAICLCKLKIHAEGLLKYLTSTLVANQDASLRRSAAEALALCGKTELDVVPALLTAALNDKDDDVRRIAEEGLAHLKLNHEKAAYLCAKQLKDSAYAENALRRCGQVAVPALTEALKEDPISREKAARALGTLGEVAVGAVPALTKALHDRDRDFRLAVAKSLWNISKNAELVTPVLVDLLDEKFPTSADEARRRYLQTVIEALWRIGPGAKAAVPALVSKSKDKNRLISESAVAALKEISTAAVPHS